LWRAAHWYRIAHAVRTLDADNWHYLGAFVVEPP
jgi:hypothetical protein